MIELNEQLLSKLRLYLERDQEAVRFIQAITEYFHSVDDIIDEKIIEPERVLKVFIQAAAVYSSNFYHRYYTQLYPLILNITNVYADSIRLEHDEEPWKRYCGDVLRSVGNDIITIVVGIVSGWEAMRDVSILIREVSYKEHHDKLTGKPI